MAACERGDMEQVAKLLAQPSDGGPRAAAGAARRGRAALHLAVQAQSVESVELLLQHNANVLSALETKQNHQTNSSKYPIYLYLFDVI